MNNSPVNPQGFPQTGDIILAGSEPPKRKKKLIVLISAICFVVVLAVGVVLVSKLNAPKTTPRLEVYDALFEFYKGTYDPSGRTIEGAYQNLLEWYDADVGFIPHLLISEEPIIFPIQIDSDSVEWLRQEMEVIENKYEGLTKINPGGFSDEELELFSQIKAGTPSVLTNIGANVAKLLKVHDAYIAPIMQMYQNGTPAVCQKNWQMLELAEDATMSAVADKYYNLYCQVISLYDSGEDLEALPSLVRASATEAAAALNEALEVIDISSVEAINQLMWSLEQ